MRSELFEIIKDRFFIERNKIDIKFPSGTPLEIKENDTEYINFCLLDKYIKNYINQKPIKMLEKKIRIIYNI
jgi:hypothetical protein